MLCLRHQVDTSMANTRTTNISTILRWIISGVIVSVVCMSLTGFSLAQDVESPAVVESPVLPSPTISVENPLETGPESVNLAWDKMDEASSYRFELCGDNECSQILHTHNNLSETQVNLQNLNPRQYFWRVSSVDAFGNVGFPSTAQPLIINVAEASKAEPNSSTNSTNKELPERKKINSITDLPWYAWLVVVAYLMYLLRILNWYFNK